MAETLTYLIVGIGFLYIVYEFIFIPFRDKFSGLNFNKEILSENTFKHLEGTWVYLGSDKKLIDMFVRKDNLKLADNLVTFDLMTSSVLEMNSEGDLSRIVTKVIDYKTGKIRFIKIQAFKNMVGKGEADIFFEEKDSSKFFEQLDYDEEKALAFQKVSWGKPIIGSWDYYFFQTFRDYKGGEINFIHPNYLIEL